MTSLLSILFLATIVVILPYGYQSCCGSCSYDRCNSCSYSSCGSCGSSGCSRSCSRDSCCTNCCNTCNSAGCYDACQRTCCPEPEPRTTTKQPPTPTPTPVRVREECKDGKTSCSSQSSGNNTVIANITSVNTINNVNHINMSINVNNEVKNEVSGDGGRGGNGSVITVTVPVPVPITVTIPVTGPCVPECNKTTCTPCPTYPPRPIYPRCCVVIIPCATAGCNPYHYKCHGCHGQIGYVPQNPCGGGCIRRPYWDRYSCNMGQCMTRRVDCSYCQDNFYENYGTYSSCHGCFFEGGGGYEGYY